MHVSLVDVYMHRSAWLVVLIGTLFALPSFDDGLVSDDYELLAEARLERIEDVRTAFTAPGHNGFFRPVPRLLLALQWMTHGLHPVGYHLMNALVHVAMCLALYGALREAAGAPPVALAASLLFAGHFVHVEPVYWIAARNEMLAAAGYAGALWMAFKPGRRYPAGAVVAFALALLSKETAVTLPLVAGLWAMHRASGVWRDRLREGVRAGLPFFVVLAGYILLRWHAGAAWPWTSRGVAFTWHPLPIFKNVAQYTLQLALPVRSLLDLADPGLYGAATRMVGEGLDQPGGRVLVFLGAALAAGGMVAVCRLGGQPARYGFGFALLTALPYLVMEGTGLRYLYLPSAGFLLAVAAALCGFLDRRGQTRRLPHLTGVAVAALLLLSMEQARWWDQAGQACRRVIDTVSRTTRTMPPGAPLYIMNLPRRTHGAYIFHNGFEAAMRLHGLSSARRIADGDRAAERGESIPREAVIVRY